MAKVESAISYLPVPADDEHSPELHAAYERMLERSGFIPNVLCNFALRPSHLLRWNEHYEELMKGDSSLSKAEREMIAVVVSVANACAYCIAAHSAALRKLTKDPALSDAVAADHASAPVEPRMHAALAYAVKLTREPERMTQADVERLRDAGWSDEDVMDIAEVTAMFNFSNRMASGLGWEPNPEYEQLGR